MFSQSGGVGAEIIQIQLQMNHRADEIIITDPTTRELSKSLNSVLDSRLLSYFPKSWPTHLHRLGARILGDFQLTRQELSVQGSLRLT